MDARVSQLPNGLRVVTAHMPLVESVALGVWIAVGSRHEPGRLRGISHMIEHVVFKGTRRRTAGEISRAVEGYGGDLNACTQEESTCYYARVCADRAESALDVLADLYRNPLFRQADLDKERAVIMDEIAMYRDQPEHHALDLLHEALWPGHPLGVAVVGRPATVMAITRAGAVAFKQRAYVPVNTVVSLAGAIRHEDAVARVRRRFRGLPAGRPVRFRPVSERAPAPWRAETREGRQAHLALGFRLFGRDDPRRFALRVLSAILGENMSSRLFQSLRERHGLVYSVNSWVQMFADSGALVAEAGTDPRHAGRVAGLLARDIAKLRRRLVGGAELRRAREYCAGQLRLELESTAGQSGWIAEHLLAYGRVADPDEAIRSIRAVTAEEVRAVAESALRPDRMSLAVVAPDGPAVAAEAVRRIGGLFD